ncbi:MAG TPA: neutral/alkaline non-lysosomal ceramidase N-terminal domain-containing protein [Thermomicrobiales bacterium]|nr:neutral/alkaline non-lysosomal ceramidase N-terminal domain-containing protein [Thermomicrobiales bacterium]
MTSTLLAGVAKVDITPPIGIAHGGWGAQSHERAAGIDMPLTVTALALRSGDQTTVIVDIDTCWLWGDHAQRALDTVTALTGLPEDAIRLSYTHTHSGPIHGREGSWIVGGAEMLPGYTEYVRQSIAGAVWSALGEMQPARVAVRSGASDISVNRRFSRPEDGAIVVGRNRAGVRDPEVLVLRVDTEGGEPLAAIVNYACHPITVGPDNDLVTPDYPGVVKALVEDATGATCLFLQGAAGDIGPVRGVARDGVNQYQRLGAILGHEAAKLWWEAEPFPTEEHYVTTLESGAPLAVYEDRPLPPASQHVRYARTTVNLPVKEIGDPEVLTAAASQHAAELEHLRSSGGSEDDIRTVTMKAKRASMRADLARNLEGSATWPVDMHAIAIGSDIALLGMAAEPFSAIGKAIKASSPFSHTLVSGYTGVGWAYLPTADAYPLGGYEVEVTPFAPDAADVAIAEALSLLESIKG